MLQASLCLNGNIDLLSYHTTPTKHERARSFWRPGMLPTGKFFSQFNTSYGRVLRSSEVRMYRTFPRRPVRRGRPAMAHEKDRMGSHEVLVCPVQLPLRSISHAGMVAGESLVRREVNSNSYWALCSPMFQLCGLWLA